MRFYTKQHQFYGGIDLHARTMYVCVLNRDGEVLLHRHMKAAPEPFLKAMAPYREDLVVCVEWAVHKSLEVDLGLITYDDQLLTDLELAIVKSAKQHDANTFYRLRSIPGVGKILALVLLYEIHDIHRFPRVQEFVSYCRLVKCAQESAGKRYGTSGTKIGNAYLTWALSEAAVLFWRANPAGQRDLTRLENTHGKGKALTVLAHKLARAVFYMCTRQTAFDMAKFLNQS
ncbi:MAG TPA: transposase [Candidatus Tectomicrobia bacterium]|nr:transposase [Candidatus Tectomicrobia bacterium]